MFSPVPFPGWATRLLTGNPEVDSEHRLLLNGITRLRQVCPDYEGRSECGNCPRGQAADCHSKLVDTLGDLLTFLVDHFFAEEQAMKSFGLIGTDKELCDRHKEDHAVISEMVVRIVSALDTPQTVGLVKQLHAVLDSWVKHHIELHDTALLEMISRR